MYIDSLKRGLVPTAELHVHMMESGVWRDIVAQGHSTQFCGRSAATRVTARVLIRQQTWRRKSNGTQKTTSQNLLIKILRHLAEVLLPSYFK